MFILKPSRLSFVEILLTRGARTILWGGAVRPREDLLESYYLHLSISNLFNRNKSGRCAPWKSKEVRSLKARFHKSGPLWIYRERSDLTYFC